MLAISHDLLDANVSTVPSIAAYVRDKIAGVVQACIDAIGAFEA